MKHNKIFKRTDGTRYKINIIVHMSTQLPTMDVLVERCLPNKKKFIDVCNVNSYKYRELSLDERREFEMISYLNVVSIEEINTTLLEMTIGIYNNCKSKYL